MKLKYINYGLFFLCAVFAYRLLSTEGGIGEYVHSQNQLTEMNQQLKIQQQENLQLKQEVKTLQTSDEGIETIARQVLGMVKENEIFIEVIPLNPASEESSSLTTDTQESSDNEFVPKRLSKEKFENLPSITSEEKVKTI